MTNEDVSYDNDRSIGLIKSVSTTEMTNIVRCAVSDDGAQVIGEWTVWPIGTSVGVGTLGICVTEGIARIHGEQTRWSVVGKVIDLSLSSDAFAFTSPTQELRAYSTGLLGTISGKHAPQSRFRAARHYGISEIDRKLRILWLEDLSDLPQPPWDDETYITTARHIGQFNGTWELNPPEHQEWFMSNGFRERFAPVIRRVADVEAHRDDVYVSRFANDAAIDQFTWITENFLRVIDELLNRSGSLAHIDVQPRNLFTAVSTSGEVETVAIDWQSVGYAPIGMDLSNMIPSSLTWIEMDVARARTLEQNVVENYINGPEDAGWEGDRDLVLLGYLTGATGRAAGGCTVPVTWVGNDEWREWQEESLGHGPVEMTDHWAEVFEWMYPRFRTAVENAGLA